MDAATLATIIISVTAVIGLIGAGVAWFYKRGGQEREFSIELRANTQATTELNASFTRFMDRTQTLQEATTAKLADHETRITVSERDIRDLRKADAQ